MGGGVPFGSNEVGEVAVFNGVASEIVDGDFGFGAVIVDLIEFYTDRSAGRVVEIAVELVAENAALPQSRVSSVSHCFPACMTIHVILPSRALEPVPSNIALPTTSPTS